MLTGYEDYLSMPMSLTLEEMALLHRQMREDICSDYESLELYEELMAAAARYMYFRSNWLLWSRDKDALRTSAHDSYQIQPAIQISEEAGKRCIMVDDLMYIICHFIRKWQGSRECQINCVFP